MSKTLKDLFVSKVPKNVVSSGTPALDKAINGFNLGKIVILTGRPSMGKTSAMLKLANNYRKLHGSTIHWMSEDESHYSLGKRYYHLNVSENQFDEIKPVNNLERFDHFKLHDSKPISQIPDWLDDLPLSTENALIVVENNVAFAPPYTTDRAVEITNVFKACNERIKGSNNLLFFSFNCSVEAENVGGIRKPAINHIPYFDYYSHLIDKAITVYRYEYYDFEQDEDGNEVNDLILLTCLYNRTGSTAAFKMIHRGVNNAMPGYTHYIDNELLELSYGEFEFTVKQHLKFVEVIVSIKNGIDIRSTNFKSLKEVWQNILGFLDIDQKDTKWLDLKLDRVSPKACGFLIAKLKTLFDSDELLTNEQKEKYSRWFEMLSDDWVNDDDWLN